MKVVFVESNTSGTGALACQRVKARGLEPVLLASDPARYRFDVAGITVATVDTNDERALLDLLQPWRPEIAAITTTSEYFVATAARLATAFDLPAPPVYAVEVCRHKGHLAAFLAAADVRVPGTRLVTAVDQADAAIAALGLPLVIKPVAGSGSVAVRRLDTREAVHRAVASLLTVRVNERGMPVPDGVLLQALVVGPEYSVEAIGTRIIGVTKKHVGGPDGAFIEVGHDFPATGPAGQATAVAEAAHRALCALGFTSGATHTEIVVGADGPTVIEVNPRLAGGYIPEIVRHAHGVDLISAVLASALGETPELTPTRDQRASIRFLLPNTAGTVASFDGVDDARALPGVVDVAIYRKPGDVLLIQGDFRDRVGHVIAVGEDAEETAAAADRALGAIVTRFAPTGTGRLTGGIPVEAQRILFGATVDSQLPHLTDQLSVDRAHLVMLVEAGILAPEHGARVLTEIERLEQTAFADLRGKIAPRGLYLVYEQHLIDATGAEAGGMLQLGRSRNDLQATVFLLRLRQSAATVAEALLDLLDSVVTQARAHQRLMMPAYTHGQPAVPITLGHYLTGVGLALSRDATGLFEAMASFQHCPLGAGAVGGTTVAIRPERTAELLGFAGALENSVDGVASRDAALRILAAATLTGITTSRFAADLLAWLGEAAFLELPDTLVGSSSMMPQKRNPYFLEHVQGRAARPLGAFVTAATAMQAKPFTNHIAVGTEAVADVTGALEDHRGALVLLRLIVEGVRPRVEAIARRAEEGFVQATEVATQLASDEALGFRGAHALVGRAVTTALDTGRPLLAVVDSELAAMGRPPLAGDYGLDAIAARAEHAGGPGTAALEATLVSLEARLPPLRERLSAMSERWTAARAALRAADLQIRAPGSK